MNETEWNSLWPVMLGLWPGDWATPATKAAWGAELSRFDREAVSRGIRALGAERDHVTLAALVTVVTEQQQRLSPRIAAPIPEQLAESEWEVVYQTNLVATQRQLVHERSCVGCRTFAEPPLGKDRRGRPCPIGMAYWEPHFRAGMARP